MSMLIMFTTYNNAQLTVSNAINNNGKLNMDVYVAGKDNGVATVWKNGVATTLTGWTEGEANSVYVSGSDVYVAGFVKGSYDDDSLYEPETYCVATIWKNGTVKALTDGTTCKGRATSVYVSGLDVYVTGFVKNSAIKLVKDDVDDKTIIKLVAINDNTCSTADLDAYYGVATVWKNGKAMALTEKTILGEVNSVYVSGSDVYAVGVLLNSHLKNVATIWKNGTATALTDGNTNAGANSVCVSGSDIYVAGFVENSDRKSIATVWKNGTATTLTNFANGIANSVYVSGSDVYVAGYIENSGGKSIATVWKNKTFIPLTDGSANARANSVYISGSDVYVAGNMENEFDNVNTVWKNGTATDLARGNNEELEVKSVMVVSK